MKSNHFGPKEVLAVLKALRDVDDLVSLVVDDLVGAPNIPLMPILLNFEPNDGLLLADLAVFRCLHCEKRGDGRLR